MRIPIDKIRQGDIVAFKGGSPFSKLLSLVDRSWRKRKWKPWHLGIAIRKVDGDWAIIEAIQRGVVVGTHSIEEIRSGARAYRWLDRRPTNAQTESFVRRHLGWGYDYSAYLGVILWWLMKKIFNRPFRIYDQQQMCWEVVTSYCREMGKPLVEVWDYPLISTIMNKLEQ